mgnify:CR=1 FL=1
MSYKYDIYLTEHKANVAKAYYWLKGNLPEVLKGNLPKNGIPGDFECDICDMHDASKNYLDEYCAYDDYFYGGNKSYEVVKDWAITKERCFLSKDSDGSEDRYN